MSDRQGRRCSNRICVRVFGVLGVGALFVAGCSGSASDSEKSLPPSLTVVTASSTTEPTTTTVAQTLPATTTTTTPPTEAPTTVLPTTAAPALTVAPTPPATIVPLATIPSIPPPKPSTTAPAVLELGPDGIGKASFGGDPEQTIQYISSVVGAPSSDSGWVAATPTSPFGICYGTDVRGVRWGDLLLLFGDEAHPDHVRHFFGYNFGTFDTNPPALTGGPAGLRTAKGITVGSTVAEVKAAYKGVQVFAGPPATFELPDADLGGELTNASPAGVVTSVYGGGGCAPPA
jgi:hypothetical protein